jgi:hypothetical protein
MWTEIINFIKDLFTGVLIQNTELKERISNLFSIISTMYFDLSEKVSKQEFNTSIETLLVILTENLYNALNNFIPVKKQEYFHNLIKEISNPEKLYYIKHDNDSITKINEIAWELKSFSEYLIKLKYEH